MPFRQESVSNVTAVRIPYNPKRLTLTIHNEAGVSIRVSDSANQVATSGRLITVGGEIGLIARDGDEPWKEYFMIATGAGPATVGIYESFEGGPKGPKVNA